MKIVISFFDKQDRTIKKTLFAGWDGNRPILVAYPNQAVDYWTERQAKDDMRLLKIMKSPHAKTLAIYLEKI